MADDLGRISAEDAIDWLLEASRYFAGRTTNGEDRAHWSNVYNAANCLRIVELLKEVLSAP